MELVKYVDQNEVKKLLCAYCKNPCSARNDDSFISRCSQWIAIDSMDGIILEKETTIDDFGSLITSIVFAG